MVRPEAVPAAIPDVSIERSILAGDWDYEDGAVIALRLDREGNGNYAWKDGRFETTDLAGRIWLGRWMQKGNDREGEFRVELSDDFSEGEGSWWYTRIGDDRAPAEKGGTFRLTRKTEGIADNSTPTPP
ncbi:conserved exported protein of unknown function [Nitrospira sp. KM1]|nr:conserved exported protein of unknown function [Nitrospira sp. KM1]